MNWLGNPNKLFESMAIGLPVIACNFGEIAKVVSEADCGLLADPDDVESVAEAIRTLAEHPEMKAKFSQNGRRSIEGRYRWEGLKTSLASSIRSLV